MNQKLCLTNLPDLLEIQKTSFCWFLSNGISEEFSKFSSILNNEENLEVLIYGQEYKLKLPQMTSLEARMKKSTYCVRLYVPVEIKQLQNFELNVKSNGSMVGASGAIMGVLVAFGMLNPNAELMLIFLPIPIKAKYFIPGIIAIDLFSAVSGVSIFSPSNTAYIAHIGGALTGFLLMYFWKKNQFDKYRWN